MVAAKAYTEIDELLRSSGADSFLVVMDTIEDPRNLGAIIRSAHCAGATGLVVPKHRAAGLTETVEKSSAGAVEYLPVARVTNITSFLESLKEGNFRVVGVETDGAQVYTEADLRGRLALVFGGESAGIRRLTRERCDLTVRIPMQGKIGSLNAAVAAGIVLFEAVRQRASEN